MENSETKSITASDIFKFIILTIILVAEVFFGIQIGNVNEEVQKNIEKLDNIEFRVQQFVESQNK